MSMTKTRWREIASHLRKGRTDHGMALELLAALKPHCTEPAPDVKAAAKAAGRRMEVSDGPTVEDSLGTTPEASATPE